MQKSSLLLCGIFLSSITLFAQHSGPSVVRIEERSKIHVAAPEAATSLVRIFGNLGTKTAAYNDTVANPIFGPNSNSGGFSNFQGLPFIPKSNAHVVQVRAAIEFQSGTNQVNLSIYTDSNGVPGTLLAGPVTVTNLPGLATCCLLAIANFSPTALTAGTRYWIVADTPVSGTGSDFSGDWVAEIRPFLSNATFFAGSWFAFSDNFLPAAEVLGTVP